MPIYRTPDGVAWERANSPSVKDTNLVDRQVLSMSVYLGGVWREAFPGTDQSVTVITTVTPPSACGGSLVVAGYVRANGTNPPNGTTVKLWYQADVYASWTAGVTGTITGGNFSLSQTNWAYCKNARVRIEYLGGGSILASDAVAVVPEVSLNPVGTLTGGAITTTGATFTWAAVPCATTYDVYRDGIKIGSTAALTYTDSGLTPGVAYSYRVSAANAVGCTGPLSPAKTATTSRTEQRATGSVEGLTVPASATNSQQDIIGWGYLGDQVAQSHPTDASKAYTGVIDYGSTVRQYVASVVGSDAHVDNLVVTGGGVRLARTTGGGAAVTACWFQCAGINTANEPQLSGVEFRSPAPTVGNTAIVSPGAANALQVLKGAVRGLALSSNNPAWYAIFGGATVACQLIVDVAWDYVAVPAVAGGWT